MKRKAKTLLVPWHITEILTCSLSPTTTFSNLEQNEGLRYFNLSLLVVLPSLDEKKHSPEKLSLMKFVNHFPKFIELALMI